MRIVKIILYTLLGLVALLALVGVFLPSVGRVERTALVEGPPEASFAFVNDLHRWGGWSPWHKMDPNMQITYAGPESGAGSSYSWKSDILSTGTMAIVRSTPASRLDMAMTFGDMDPSDIVMTFAPEGDKTRITWTLTSDFGWNIPGRYFGTLFDLTMGPDFEAGLRSLDSLVRATPRGRVAAITVADMPATHWITVKAGTVRTADMGTTLARSYGSLMQYLGRTGRTPVAPPSCFYSTWDGASATMEPALQVAAPDKGAGPIVGRTIPAGTVMMVDYYGPYEHVSLAHEAADAEAKKRKMDLDPTPWEEYHTDPQTAPDPADWHTRVYYRIRRTFAQ